MKNHLIPVFGEIDTFKSAESEFIKAGLEFLANQKPTTRICYAGSLKQFFDFTKKVPNEITSMDVTRFKLSLKNRGLKDSTIGNKLAAISAYYQFLQIPRDVAGTVLAQANPVHKGHREDIKVDPYSRATKLPINDFKKIISMVDLDTVKGLRDYAILLFYFFTGRRRSEIAKLCYSDLSFEDNAVWYTFKAKGGKIRRKQMFKPIVDAIYKYWQESGRVIEKYSPLFVATRDNAKYLGYDVSEDKPLTGEAIRQMVKHYAKKAGLDIEKVKVHSIRHLFAEVQLEIGSSVHKIMEDLCHSNLNTTQIYLNTLVNKKDDSWEKMQEFLE